MSIYEPVINMASLYTLRIIIYKTQNMYIENFLTKNPPILCVPSHNHISVREVYMFENIASIHFNVADENIIMQRICSRFWVVSSST